MSTPKFEIPVPPDKEGTRLDIFLASQNINLTRSRIQKLIETGKILVNNLPTKASHKVKAAEKITVEIPPPKESKILPENLPLNIVYEDDELLVINKPAGMVVHPAAGNYSGTLVNALLYHCKDLSGIGGVLRPGIVHRLDKGTSGFLVVAKNDSAHLKLSEQLQDKTLYREYIAIICGNMPKKAGSIQAPIGRSLKDRKKMVVTKIKSKEAWTEFKVLKSFSLCDLLQLKLKTGRTHQIRVHLSYLGHPVLGDPEYGGRIKWLSSLSVIKRKMAQELLNLIPRQALHAFKLGFIHPKTNQYQEFESRIPLDISKVIDFLEAYEI
ncbi:MAG: hypothetical protein A2145_05845 [candidate division Zixibacteria bacterium RBG_16_40_9]|nr:MAG: hypothetical protein A2145_05845 [candidate division Zixibacteria bacterium RBG_16_40_9]